MSHVVVIQTQVHDQTAVVAACKRLHLSAPVQGTARLFGGEATGLQVKFPGWQYPAVIDTLTGAIRCDTYGGRWGDQSHLDLFLQAYAVERTKIEARKKGLQFSETALQDGSIKVQLTEGGT